MMPDPAFELDDLMVLLDLDLSDPADQADIEAVEAVLERRRTGGAIPSEGRGRPGPTLRLVPDSPS
jgi:hypothetical protein